ncbi:hypothetical protein EV426DRAFT_704724 [Tirmania nivea]|nr:hypothetical protein EV426DRAFT_704724 [Tirmania nivea]
MRQHSAYSSRQGSAQSGFLSYSANHRNVVPPRPLSLRPISQATSIALSDSEYESHSDLARERGKSMIGSKGWRQQDIKEEDEGPGQIPEEVSDAESMESLSSRARHMQGILTDSDSMHSSSRTRTSISSFSASEAATPEQSPLPHYGEPAIYDPDNKSSMIYRHSMSYGEELPRYTTKENMITTIGPKGPHLFRSLSVCSNVPSAAATRLASTADFIPPTPVTPLDVTEFEIPASLNTAMYIDQRRLSLQFSPTSPIATQHQHHSCELVQEMERSFNPESDIRPLSTLSAAVINDYDQLDIMDWTPQQVCQHLAKVGFEKTIVEKFARNDISGQILVDLKWEDLKELDIQSFGKRIEVWSEIHHLRCRSSTGTVEQFATYRPESRMSRTASHRSARPSPASSRPALTPRTPHVEALKPIAYNGDIQEEDEDEDQPRSVSSEDEETTIAVRLMRTPTRRRRVRTKKGTHARISRKRFSSADSGTDAAETTESEQVLHMKVVREALPTLREIPKRRHNPAPDSIVPGDSISVAGRRTCKAHTKCKKGDKCGKHGGRKQSTKEAQNLQKRALPQRSTAGTILIAATPSIAQAMTIKASGGSLVSPNDTTRPGSLVAPSVLASSDVLGPIQSREVRLQEGALKEIIAMDPAENVKKFLIHQHLQHLEERRKEPPPVPQKSNEEIMRALASPGSVLPQEYYEEAPEAAGYETEQEDQVPEIGSLMFSVGDGYVPPMSPAINRSKTPSLGLRTANLTPAPAGSTGFSPMSYRARGSMLRTTTPFSEMDVPIGSSTPMIAEFRNQSASVPPDMSYGVGQRGAMNRSSFGMPSTAGKLMAPAPPPPAAGISRRGAQSTTGVRPQVVVLDDLEENAEWEDASDKTSIQEIRAQKASNDVLNSSIRVHSGWMRKRKTNWFRHEWPEHHFVLRGTRLGIHKDQHSAEDGFIEMEDYSVACSNSASTKLSAAFKSWKIKNDQGNANDGAFFFQLVPCNDKEKRGKGVSVGKEKKVVHHFAVKTRDERIDWMRELMLAKAIKQKGEGCDVEVNGEKI